MTTAKHVRHQDAPLRSRRYGPGAARFAAHFAAVLLAGCLVPQAWATEPAALAWAPVDSARLAGARGGFVGQSGLQVSLGIERLVTLNGNIVSRVHVEIPDIANLGVQGAREAEQALSAINLVRNGPDTMVGASLAHAAPGTTLIQNSLNGQQIDSRTVISSSVNTLGLLTSLNFQGSLGDAIARSARPL